MASTPYQFRVQNDELDRLKKRAVEEGVELSTAMRQGAAMYLNATPEEREALQASTSLASTLVTMHDQVETARSALRSLNYD